MRIINEEKLFRFKQKGYTVTRMGFSINDNSKDTVNAQIPAMDFRHVLIEGSTGNGKTASFILPTLNDRISRNNAIIFFEHKGHEHRKIKLLAEQNNRLSDVIELGKVTGSYINILAMFDSNMLTSVITKLCGNEDIYWSMASAQLAVRVVELHRKLHKIGDILVSTFAVDKEIFTVNLMDEHFSEYGMLKIEEEASFLTLAKIVRTPNSLTSFFKKLKVIQKVIDKEIQIIYKVHVENEKYINKIKMLISEFITFEELLDKYANFLVEDSSEASGNNGVLQILNNAISTLSTLDYLNKSEVDILKVIDENAIIIIDTQAISISVYAVFIESLLQKLSGRIKYQIPKEISIFIDEANRVLRKNIDLQNDVLRESRVELVLAIQNENQMILKFGETEWEAIVANVRQRYYIDGNHAIYCNEGALGVVSPMLFNEDALNQIEYKYNSLAINKQYIKNRFIFESLPQYYRIVYDLYRFSQDSTLELVSDNGETSSITYVGENVKKKTESKIDKYNLRASIQV